VKSERAVAGVDAAYRNRRVSGYGAKEAVEAEVEGRRDRSVGYIAQPSSSCINEERALRTGGRYELLSAEVEVS
jgi:hypothetical protein